MEIYNKRECNVYNLVFSPSN